MIRVTPLILAVALFMEQMDSTVIATSLPAIAADIGTEPIALKLALTAYFVALAIFIPISGWMADRFGAKNIFRLAILVFMLGSLACSFSFSLESFVVSRFFQGIGSSMMTPVGRLLLVRSTPRSELVGAMAWLTIPALLGPLTGPLIGGFLTTYLSWHWIFWINIPIGIAGIILAGIFLKVPDARIPRPIDAVGFILAGIAFAGCVFGLSVVSLPALPLVYGYLTIAIGAVSGIFYFLHAKRTTFPLLDPALLRHKLFRASILGGSFFRIGVGAVPFLLPLMLQLGFGLNPFQSGAITFVSAIGAIMSKFIAERVFARFGFPRILGFAALFGGLLIAAQGLFSIDTPIPVMMAVLLAGGVLRSVFFTGTNALGYADVSDEEASQATAIVAVCQQLSIAFGVAVAGGILEVSTRMHGGELSLFDFQLAFFVVGGLSALAGLIYWRLPADAGHDVSGHKAIAKE
ncbi:MAG: MFS transporter [Alphaproteobacteria bacterium]|uniref:MFS transporter n=1 Tax=Devosia sp. XGJD_8 TaxID=3391187 RepID=UPI001D5866B8|nr:MFS transporter [Alphaproteobacteria bacterium]MBU1561724.1 MFS transporter [Alphaproteobacteria bacterium]MBU2303002.1 MFS transporter [Alphaproteobacteria bacterium]MBU2368788.1 MFS transporter [Alphaproteobacteria bacterium]